MDPIKFELKTYGCKVNTYDSGLLQKRLASQGFVSEGAPEVHILNTCAVTEEATKEALKTLRQLRRKNPQATLVVTGCSAQVDTEKFIEQGTADLIVANSHKGQLEDLIRQSLKGELDSKVHKSNIFKKTDLEPGGGEETLHTRSFLKIQDGCDSFCTFCVIPFARGKSRSLPMDRLIDRIQELYAKGVRELVLTGVHIGDYRDESRPGRGGLEDLVEQVLLKTSMPRLRLSSLEPPELTEPLLDLYSDDRLCPHFHMSIQSAHTRVLQAMKRKYSAKEVEISLKTIADRLPGAFVGMDLIVGFPGETEEEFYETYRRLRDWPWSRIHVFPYSSRPGTYAARLTQAPEAPEIKARARRMRELSQQRFEDQAKSQLGSQKRALILSSKGSRLRALSRDYWPLELSDFSTELRPGVEVPIQVKDWTPKGLVGSLTLSSAKIGS